MSVVAQAVEERSLRAGHLAVLLGDFDSAEKLFLESSQPMEALNVGSLRFH